MGISVFVFEERAAPAAADYIDWIRKQIADARTTAWDRPESSSVSLQKWFADMRKTFPLIGEADPDDSRGTEYCFYQNVIDVVFAGSVGEKGILTAWKLTDKHGLRLLVGDELLPKKAPRGKRDFHISVLDGRRSDQAGGTPNVCFVVVDPSVAPIKPSTVRSWVLDQLEREAWGKDQSILAGDRLRSVVSELQARKLSRLVSETRLYREFVFIRVSQRNGEAIVSPIMELSHRLGLVLEIYVDLP